MKMKKLIAVAMAALLAVSTFAGCGISKAEKNVTQTSTDGKYSVSIPSDWEDLSGQLNSVANLECGNLSKEQYLAAIPDSKVDFTGTFDEYTDIIIGNIVSNVEGASEGERQSIDLNGNSAYLTEISGSVDNINITYWVYTVDCTDDYVQVLVWTLKSKADENKETLQNAAASFKETGNEANDLQGTISPEESSSNEPQQIVLIDSGWSVSQSSDYTDVSYAVKIQNPNEKYAVVFPTITITARDAEGKILKNEEQVLHYIAAEDTIMYANNISYEGATPTTVDISVKNGTNDYEEQDDSKYIKISNFSFQNTSENKGSYSTTYTGEITNNSNVDFSTIAISVIYKSGEKLIGGTSGYVDDLMTGTTMPFEISSWSDISGYDSIEFYAIPW
jgi:hypothetical protein